MFIDSTDIVTGGLYQELLDAITREDDSILLFAINTAEEEMRGYLRPDYDVDTIFSATGSARQSLLVTLMRDMAIYHLLSLSNPGSHQEIEENRCNKACLFHLLRRYLMINSHLEKRRE